MNATHIKFISGNDDEFVFAIDNPKYVQVNGYTKVEYVPDLYTISTHDVKEIINSIIDKNTICMMMGEYMHKDGMSIILQGAEIYDKYIKDIKEK